MPDGVVLWFDPASGDARIGRGGRRYPAKTSDLESSARRAGARVHFDIHREHAVDTAVDVRLREGGRTSSGHHRVGTLAGAYRPDTKGPALIDHPHVEHGLALAGHPLAVAGAWGRWFADGDLDHALKLYAPDAEIHHDGVTIAGRAPLQSFLEVNPLLASHREPTVHGEGDVVVVRWGALGPDEPGLEVRCRVEHGEIAEQWIATAQSKTTATIEVTPSGPVVFDAVTKGDVGAEPVSYARQRLLALTDLVGEPILFARVKLAVAADPARSRPALAQATLDVNGRLVRAHVAARDLHEAIDLLQQRLRNKLQHLAEHRKAERHLDEPPEPGEWRHGDLPTVRPDYFDRPIEERELVRHKAFIPDELTADEAAFDMNQLDYDFHLYRDLASGQDSLLERHANQSYVLHHLHGPVDDGPPRASTAYPIDVDDTPVPELTVQQAIERLSITGQTFVFFADTTTGRGEVVYRRYDGHHGLITL